MPRHRGQIWEYFEDETVTKTVNGRDVTITFAKCKECKKNYRFNDGNTTGMRGHLRRDHPPAFATLERDKKNAKKRSANATLDYSEKDGEEYEPIVLGRYVGASGWAKFQLRDAQQLRADLEIVRALVRGDLPFTTVDQSWFRDLVNHFAPNVTFKTASMYSRFKLPLLYDNVKKAVDDILADELPLAAGFGISLDRWTGKNADSYRSLTVHYINEQFVLRRFAYSVANFDDGLTAGAVAKRLDAMVAGLPGNVGDVPVTVVHESAVSGVKSAVPKNSQIDQFLVCIDHQLNLLVNDSIVQSPAANEAVCRCTELVALCRESSRASDRIRREIEASNDDPTGLDASYSRWLTGSTTARLNSAYSMIDGVLRMRRPLENIARNYGGDPSAEAIARRVPSADDFGLFEEMMVVLERLNGMSEALATRDHDGTVHRVVAQLFGMHVRLDRAVRSGVSPAAETFFRVLRENLDVRFPDYGSHVPHYAVGNLLNPLYRGFALKKAGRFEWARDLLAKEQLAGHKAWLARALGRALQDGPRDVGDVGDIDDPLLQSMAEEEEEEKKKEKEGQAGESQVVPTMSDVEAEWDAYSAMPKNAKEIMNESCLSWWKANRAKLPLLAECARRWLCVPASTTTLERDFTAAAGGIGGKKKTKLPTADFVDDKLLFVRQNHDRVTVKRWILAGGEVGIGDDGVKVEEEEEEEEE